MTDIFNLLVLQLGISYSSSYRCCECHHQSIQPLGRHDFHIHILFQMQTLTLPLLQHHHLY